MNPVELVAWTSMTTLTIVSWVMTIHAFTSRNEAQFATEQAKKAMARAELEVRAYTNDMTIWRTRFETLTEATKRIAVENPAKEAK